jgi:hypothetical protein
MTNTPNSELSTGSSPHLREAEHSSPHGNADDRVHLGPELPCRPSAPEPGVDRRASIPLVYTFDTNGVTTAHTLDELASASNDVTTTTGAVALAERINAAILEASSKHPAADANGTFPLLKRGKILVGNLKSLFSSSSPSSRASSSARTPEDTKPLHVIDELSAEEHFKRRVAECKNLGNPKIYKLTGNGKVKRKPVPLGSPLMAVDEEALEDGEVLNLDDLADTDDEMESKGQPAPRDASSVPPSLGGSVEEDDGDDVAGLERRVLRRQFEARRELQRAMSEYGMGVEVPFRLAEDSDLVDGTYRGMQFANPPRPTHVSPFTRPVRTRPTIVAARSPLRTTTTATPSPVKDQSPAVLLEPVTNLLPANDNGTHQRKRSDTTLKALDITQSSEPTPLGRRGLGEGPDKPRFDGETSKPSSPRSSVRSSVRRSRPLSWGFRDLEAMMSYDNGPRRKAQEDEGRRGEEKGENRREEEKEGS